MHRPPISVVIPCKDEEHHLAACVQSVLGWADEILIADSGSTDKTLAIAHDFCTAHPRLCRLIQREFISFGSFKGWAVNQCRHDWVLVLDADERMTPALRREIDKVLSKSDCPDAFLVGFDHYYLGYRIRHGAWNHKVVRLFRKSVANYDAGAIHEKVVVSTGRVGILKGRLEHRTCTCLDRWYQKKNRYTTVGALEKWKRGKRARLWDLTLRPITAFVKSFIVKMGFLDGMGGFLVAVDDAVTTFQTYLKLWAIAHPRTAELTRGSSAAENDVLAHLPKRSDVTFDTGIGADSSSRVELAHS
jgi:glycosyltransferase involved in cell wall biosynthesis